MSSTSRDTRPSLTSTRFDDVAEALEPAGPAAVLSWAFAEFGPDVAIATGFGVEGAALIDIAAKINPRPFVFFVDTGFHFAETLELRRRIERRYGVEIHALEPELTPDQQADVFGVRLWHHDPDFCCSM